MGRPWVLAVDLGSGGPKVGAVGLDGQLYATHFTPVPTIHTADGGSEQDAELWWEGIRAAARSFVEGSVVRGEDLHAVGLTGQYGSLVPVGHDGQAVGRCLMWSDHRGAEYAREAVGGPAFGWAPDVALQGIRYTGFVPSVTGETRLGHELWLRSCRPEILSRTDVLLEPVDYLGLRLTGRAAATVASSLTDALVDTRPGRPPRHVPWLVQRYGHDPALLPDLLPTGSVLGTIQSSVAVEIGVRAGAPVVCGFPDVHAAVVGSGATRDYQVHLTVSTTSWQTCRVPFKRVNLRTYLTSIPGLEAGSYLVWNDQASAGYCLEWWRDRLGEVAGMGDSAGKSYEDVLALAATAAPGSGGTVFLPWLRGERSPVDDRLARAGFVNLSARTTVADMSRAVLEGVAMNARWLSEALERFIRRPVPSMRVLGGGARSDLWCQVLADVLGRPLERVADPMNAQVRGAALLALVGVGDISLEQAADRVPVIDRFLPEPGSPEVYDPLFEEFTGIFTSLRRHHHALNG